MTWAEFRREAGILMRKVFLAVFRFVALIIFMGMHYILNEIAQYVVPERWKRSRELLEGIFFVGFAVVYLEQVSK